MQTETSVSLVASVGIDISKDNLDVGLLFDDQKCGKFQFTNDSKGVKSVVSLLQKQRTAETVPCVIESTGNYHFRSALMITQAGYMVNVINPLITKKYQKSSVRNAKSDSIDAERLAQIGLIEPNLPEFKADTRHIATRKQVMYLAHLEKIRQQMKMSLRQFQEVNKLLKQNVNLQSIKRALKAIDAQIAVLNKLICEKSTPKVKKLAKECPGLSEEKAALLFAFLADKQFTNRDQLVAFVGLDVALRKSGKWSGRQKLSKRGEPYLRKVLYQIAWGLKQHNPKYREYYLRLYNEQGKHYTTAMIAVARKFLRYIFAYYFKEQSSN